MTIVKDIENEFARYGIVRAGIIFLPNDVCLAMLKRCYQLKLDIVGIDAFIVTPSVTQPVQEKSLDLSSFPKEAAYLQARDHIKSLQDSGLYFEVIYKE